MSPTVRVPVTNGPAAARPAPLPALTVTPPALASSPSPTESPLTPLINMGGVESSTNELPLSAIPFGSRTASWPRLADGSQCSTPRDAGRRQRHSIAGQMSYLKMLGLGARGKLSAAGLFSTAVISGSSSAPNLRVMIPTAASSNGEYPRLSAPLEPAAPTDCLPRSGGGGVRRSAGHPAAGDAAQRAVAAPAGRLPGARHGGARAAGHAARAARAAAAQAALAHQQ